MKFMLNMNDLNRIKEIITSKNASEFISVLIKQYSMMSVENAQELISLNSEIAKSIITLNAKQIKETNEGLFWLMAQREMTDKDVAAFFSSMVPVCKIYFPNGKCVSGNQAEEKYFSKFLRLFKDKKVFSWEKDLGWAENYGYDEYLRLVEQENCL